MTNDEVKTLIKKRGAIKQRQTLFEKYFNGIFSFCLDRSLEEIDKSKIVELQVRFEKYTALFEEFENIQIEIEVLHENLDEQLIERDAFDTAYFRCFANCKKFLDDYSTTQIPQQNVQGTNISEQYALSQNGNVSNNMSTNIKLPQINLPKFSGLYENWMEFRDTFDSLINSNTSISDIQKFHYLRASLEGGAAQVIRSLEFSSTNYRVAWDLLLQRYNNINILIYNHVKSIFELSNITKESPGELRKMLDGVSKHLRSLQILEQPVDKWDVLLVYILTHKLDKISAREWEQHKILLDTCNNNDDDNRSVGSSMKSRVASLEDFKTFIRNRADFLETVAMTKENKPQSHSFQVIASNQNHKYHCVFCKKSNHFIQNCIEFSKLPSNEKLTQINNKKLCINCLRGSHLVKNCFSGHCKKCNLKHNTILHYDFQQKPNKPSTQQDQTDSSSSQVSSNQTHSFTVASNNANCKVLLSTALVNVQDITGSFVTCRALLDSASQSHFMTDVLCKKLKIPTSPIKMSVSGINQITSNISKRGNIVIQSLQNSFSANISCLVLPCINEKLPDYAIDDTLLEIPSNLQLADPAFSKGSTIDLLIGAELFYNLLSIGQIRLGPGLPTLQKTVLGWVVSGPIPSAMFTNTSCNMVTNSELDQLVSRFWEIEESFSVKTVLSPEEQECEKIFQTTTKRDTDGRFIVQIPLKLESSSLGNSKQNALKRLKSIESKFAKQESFKSLYMQFMAEYISLGHMSLVSNEIQPSFFFPHHGIFNEQNQTTKLRVVFDGSCKSDSGISFNDIQFIGPTIQEDLFSILLRFRQGRIVICADIVKMYRQIQVDPSQWPLQSILWRFNHSDEIHTYHLKTVTYGTASAPWLAVRCLKQLALEAAESFPQASEIIIRDFYMDDLLTSCDTEAQAIELCNQISSILAAGCFVLQKWASNSPNVLEHVRSLCPTAILKLGQNEKTKTLGLYWSCESDHLMYTISNSSSSTSVTKRNILAELSQIFDPLGLLGPCIIIGKILLQSLWLLKLSWDESVPSHIFTRWQTFREQLSQLNTLRIPRQVISSECPNIQIHGFSDASLEAYGACIYLRSESNTGKVSVALLCAKTKVAPLKSLTIPRLELCGALLLARLVSKVRTSMTISFRDVFLWTDSTVCLAWIRTPPNTLQTFVQNRVAQIQSLTNPSNWNHVSTKQNPADFLSRGILPQQLSNENIWWLGPEFLLRPSDEWPKFDLNTQETIPELRKYVTSCANFHFIPWIDIQNYSNIKKLKRVMAFCLRFITNCRSKSVNRQYGPLTAQELSVSLMVFVKMSQFEAFPEEMSALQCGKPLPRKSRLISLNPFLDEDGVIRVGGRLQNSKFSFEKRHPAIISPKHYLTKLLFRNEHLRLHHVGSQQLLSSIREQFWPLAARNLARQIVHSCVICFRAKPVQHTPIMGVLPENRVTPAPVFYRTGIDYAGPILIINKRGRGCKTSKAYIALFICLTTKAIHLELVSDLTTENFIACFRRFTSRRGKPLDVFSDNGTNFVGAYSELRELSNFLLQNEGELQDKISNSGVNWHFIPAFSPHFGGIWEAGVKAAKRHLRRVVGNARLTFEELYTILTEIEAILNSRPLTPLTSDPDDLSALTPSHFIIGRPITNLPDPDLRDIKSSRLSRYQYMQQVQQHFWTRWSKEFISELQVRKKWTTHKNPLQLGALVLIKSDNTPPLKWPLGRITLLHPGPDGIARVASIKTSNGVVKRSFAKICVLPIEEKSKDN